MAALSAYFIRSRVRSLLCGICLAGSSLSPTAAQDAAERDSTQTLWEVHLNGRSLGEFVPIMRDAGGQSMVDSALLFEAGLELTGLPLMDYGSDRLIAINHIPGVKVETDITTQTIRLHVPPSGFGLQRFDLQSSGRVGADSTVPGLLLNYDFNYLKSSGLSVTSGLLEIAGFSPFGLLTSRLVARDLAAARTIYRLDTQFARDFPDHAATLTVGDAMTGLSSWSRSVYFGGIQWQTRFGTRPDLQPRPLPLMSGVAAAPSQVDLYVDNVLRARQTVATGPFEISNLPVFNGQGTVQLVVRDILGRQQVLSENYMTSPQLLKPGLRDLSFDAGWRRVGYGTSQASYRDPFASVTWRQGLSESTMDLHAEASRTQGAFGVGIAAPWKNLLLASSVIAASTAPSGTGKLASIQLDSHAQSRGASMKLQLATARFTTLGYSDVDRFPTRQFQANVHQNLGSHASLGIGYLDQRRPGQSDLQAATATVTSNLSSSKFFSIGLTRVLGTARATMINAGLTIALDDNAVAQVSAAKGSGATDISADYQRTAPADGGWGYRLRQSVLEQGTSHASASDVGVTHASDFGQISAGMARQDRSQSMQLQARGGIVALGGAMFATNWLDDSFAVVHVPVSNPVDIYANNRKVGRTDRDGNGIIPRLASYARNTVHLDDAALPLNVSLDLAQREVVPAGRGGLWLKFEVKLNDGVTLALVTEDGRPLPVGTKVRWHGDSAQFEVGLRGEVFMPDEAKAASIEAVLPQGRCTAQIHRPEPAQYFARLGPSVCSREQGS